MVPCTPYPGFAGSASGLAGCIPGTRHFGNEGRKLPHRPAFRQIDFSIFKKTSITERLKMELRFEAYNLFNHPNFASPLWRNFLSDPTLTNSFNPNGTLKGYLPINVTADVGAGYPVLAEVVRAACRSPRSSPSNFGQPVFEPNGPGSLSPGPFGSAPSNPHLSTFSVHSSGIAAIPMRIRIFRADSTNHCVFLRLSTPAQSGRKRSTSPPPATLSPHSNL